MKINRNLVGLLAIGALAFVAGRSGLFSGGSTAVADPVQDTTQEQTHEHDQGMSQEMQAWMKANMPGKHHGHLKMLTGNWEGQWRIRSAPDAEWMESTGTIRRNMIFDGRYLEENIEATSDMGTFHGRGYMAYDNIDGQYEMVWLDNMSTGLYFESGTYDADSKQFTMYGEHRDPMTGHIMRGYGTLDVSNPDRHQYVGYMVTSEGKRFKSFTATMERISD